MNSNLLALALCLAPFALPSAAQDAEAPPSMVLIRGGRGSIGLSDKEALELGSEVTNKFEVFARSTPQHEMRLDSYFLMTTEVTNEQYFEFVKATGHRPPRSWGELAIQEGSRQFGEELGLKRKQAKEAGEPMPTEKFDPERWWDENWEKSDWSIPAGQDHVPVTFVDYQDAQAYARWTGLRLPTEFEYQYAGRGRTKNSYPWGEAWVENAAVSLELRRSQPSPVASVPSGATEAGVYDLVGNVWEWTDSPFVPYPKFKMLQLEFKERGKKRTIDAVIGWDPDMRVCVGGSFQNPSTACQLWVRNDVTRNQRTNSLGFRCAASETPGVDMASTVLRDDLPVSKRPAGVTYEPNNAIAADRWESREGEVMVRDKSGKAEKLESYAIITGYEYVLFIPVEKVDAVAVRDLDELSIEEQPVHFGVLSITEDAIEPALAAGTYTIAYRGAGERRRRGAPKKDKEAEDGTDSSRQEDDEESFDDVEQVLPEGLDKEQANFIFYDPNGDPVAFMEAGSLNSKRPEPPTIQIGPGTREVITQVMNPKTEEMEDVVTQEPVTVASFHLTALAKVSNKGYVFDLPIKFEKGAIGEGWRTKDR